MSRIRIKHFGPIKEGFLENDGWIDISKVTIFIGNQGSGKSTVAKLISTFTWMEKSLVRGDHDKKWFEEENRMLTSFFPYHKLENYSNNKTNILNNAIIDYEGDAYAISYHNNQLNFLEKKYKPYSLPQIMYVPAERNFISYVKSTKELKLSSDSLKEFLTQYDEAKYSMDLELLPINNVSADWDFGKDSIRLRGENYEIDLSEASSGFQSLVPVFLVSQHLAKLVVNQSLKVSKMTIDEESRFRREFVEIVNDPNLTGDQRRLAISVLSAKFNKTAFINIVEEPEQNLYPSSQWALLKSLLEFNNLSVGNRLVMTTHSPYIVNYMSIAIEAGLLQEKLKGDASLLEELYAIVPEKSIVGPNDVSIYELDELTGTIKKLLTYEGIPSDANLLNKSLADGNEIFDQLLELEQKIVSK